MQRDDALAALDEVGEDLLLIGRERRVIAVDEDRVVVLDAVGGERRRREHRRQLNAVARERGADGLIETSRRMRRLILAEEQHLERAPCVGCRLRSRLREHDRIVCDPQHGQSW